MKRKRCNIASLRRGRRVMTLAGDGDEVTDEALDKCLPMEVVRVDRTSEAPDYVLLEVKSYTSGISHGVGRFDAGTVAYMATDEDIKRADQRREELEREDESGADSGGEPEAEPLGVTANQPDAVMAELPAGWPSFPKGLTLTTPSQD